MFKYFNGGISLFKDIPFTYGKYSIDEYGRVKRNPKPSKTRKDRGVKERILKPWKNNKGYYLVALRINNKTEKFLVHRLVAMVFIDNPEGYKLVNHKDSNTENNHVSNLEWCNHSQNNKHGYDFGNRVLTETQLESRRKPKTYLHKKVVQLDKDTLEVIATYNSVTEASKLTGYNLSAIANCCKGRRSTSYGFKWQYI